jgi:4-amino-4-deoxy-L-arabinose transferase-like glycosyltransferase
VLTHRHREMNRLVTELRNDKLLALQLALLIAVSLLLRLPGLGYSNFQGDEILTLCRASDYETRGQFLGYLLEQRKGPVQFLITCAYSLVDPGFSSELALRLPFAIANLVALLCFFLVVRRLFTTQIAIYASFLFATNGIFIAFARIVQYQSFVLLGGVVGILALVLALQDERWKVAGLYLGFLAVAMSLLAHFDAASFLSSMAVLVLLWLRKFYRQPGFARLLAHLIAAAGISLVLVLAFYIEYAQHLGSYQLQYWENRFTGESTDILRLFQFYNPGPVLWIGLAWILLGLTRIRNTTGWQVALAWALPPLIFMSLIFKDSRTHAYTYILPLFVIAGVGVNEMINWIQKLLHERSSQLARTAVPVIFLMFAYISYGIFIDHDPEYPWYPKHVLGMELKGGNLTGTFGFPYSRKWREIGKWFDELPKDRDVILATNEKRQFVSFYLPSNARNRVQYSAPGFPPDVRAPHGLYILIVHGPQSWMTRFWNLPLQAWHEQFVPLQDFVNEDGEIVASVYFLTQEQIERGFAEDVRLASQLDIREAVPSLIEDAFVRGEI